VHVQVVISGRNYDAAQSVPRRLELPEGCSLDEALGVVAGLFPPGERLPESCLVAVSGTHLGTLRKHRSRQLKDGDELVLIAPVAGG
jgi:molybdopterin converting factor small subunit